jgi:hypothetical protein
MKSAFMMEFYAGKNSLLVSAANVSNIMKTLNPIPKGPTVITIPSNVKGTVVQDFLVSVLFMDHGPQISRLKGFSFIFCFTKLLEYFDVSAL